VAHTCILAIWEADTKRITAASLSKQFLRPHLQSNQSKMDWSVDQGVECLLCKHEAVSSNPHPTKDNMKIK
jgi:hypothetical protein